MRQRLAHRMAILLSALIVASCLSHEPPAVEGSNTSTEMDEFTMLPVTPPVATSRPHVVTSPHGERVDPYYWMRDDQRVAPDVIAYLEAENSYTEAASGSLGSLEENIYQEIVGKIKQDDSSVPVRENGYWYYTRFESGQEYPIHARRKGARDADEQILLNGNLLAKGYDFFQIGSYEVTPDGRWLAWAEDTVGRRQWTIRFKDLQTGEVLETRIANSESSFAWANDNRTLLYIEKDPETLLGYKVRKHRLGADPAEDPLVYEEPDKSFYVDVSKSRSERFLMIVLDSTVSSEYLVADADDPDLEFKVVIPRKRDHEYSLEDFGSSWIVRTNQDALNFRVVTAPMASVRDQRTWVDVVAHRDLAFIESFQVFNDFLVVEERSGGLANVRIHRWQDAAEHVVQSEDAAYTMALGANPEPGSDTVRYLYTSPTTPTTTFDYNVGDRTKTVLKRDAVLGDFDSANYQAELLWVPARDGVTKVPVSLFYRLPFARDGSAPLYLTGYGSYGLSSDPSFSISRLTLADRGFVVATAHVRGGQEMGRRWYDGGRLLNKVNTFTDFIDATRYLVSERYADKNRVSAMGGSAGGLLMGAVANMAPQDYRAIVAHVPFVDVVTTMLDESIPLTTNEFDEWGNPVEKQYYDYMLGYSPYDNVSAQIYPAMLVTSGLWDSQVQYWEPTKWVARLRATKTGDNALFLKTNMEAGHGGQSGRFRRIRETAFEYAFVITELDAPHAPLARPVEATGEAR